MHSLHEQEPQPSAGHFDLKSFLRHREGDPNFVMIEIGHGGNPTVKHQTFKGKRAYIGIESWQRNKIFFKKLWSRKILAIQKRSDENIFFHEHDTGYRPRDSYANDAISVSEGFYEDGKIETIFPPGAADELYLSNVFGDPQVGKGKNAFMLLEEVRRLTADNGIVVIRETLSPHRSKVSLMKEEELQEEGFRVEAKIFPYENPAQWKALEKTYAGGAAPTCWMDAPNHYLILSKIPKVASA